MHRDVSVGNILITDQVRLDEDKKSIGFLHDYDYSSMETDSDEEREADELSDSSAEPGEGDPTQTAIAPDDPAKYKERTVGITVSISGILANETSVI